MQQSGHAPITHAPLAGTHGHIHLCVCHTHKLRHTRVYTYARCIWGHTHTYTCKGDADAHIRTHAQTPLCKSALKHHIHSVAATCLHISFVPWLQVTPGMRTRQHRGISGGLNHSSSNPCSPSQLSSELCPRDFSWPPVPGLIQVRTPEVLLPLSSQDLGWLVYGTTWPTPSLPRETHPEPKSVNCKMGEIQAQPLGQASPVNIPMGSPFQECLNLQRQPSEE